MILISVIPEERKAIVSYPADFKLPQKEITVFSKNDVKFKWESEVREFVHATLRKWVISRCVSYVTQSELTPSRHKAVDKLLLMLSYHQESRLHLLCRRIVQDADYFVELFPDKKSRHYPYFESVIAQVLMWCDMYAKHYEEFNNNIIKSN